MKRTVGIIKPEAIERGLVKTIIERIVGADLIIESLVCRKLSPEEFDLIYGDVQEPKWLHDKRKKYLVSKEVILLKIKGENAEKKLLEIRGCSNPKDALPGTIRGDFAKDQDYVKLRRQKKIALNIFHACDTEQEANNLIMKLGL
jgi:nucleoside-diphosphate kinase